VRLAVQQEEQDRVHADHILKVGVMELQPVNQSRCLSKILNLRNRKRRCKSWDWKPCFVDKSRQNHVHLAESVNVVQLLAV